MALVLGFVELLGAALLLTSAIADASFAQVIKGQAGTLYREQQTSSATGTSTSMSPTSSGGTVGSSATSLVRALVSRGLTPIAAAGVVGNLQQESSLDPGAPGGGLAQWIGDRWTALVSYAASKGLSPSSATAQIDFLVHELQTSYPGTLTAINKASSPGQAATIFSEQYERPGIPDLSNRVSYASQAFHAYMQWLEG